jgi:hypothetical protein
VDSEELLHDIGLRRLDVGLDVIPVGHLSAPLGRVSLQR